MMTKVCRSTLFILAGTAALGALAISPAAAQTIPLASFSQHQSGTPFHYSANAGPADATFTAVENVDFSFLNAAQFGAPAGTFLNATLTLTGHALDIASGIGSLSQPVQIDSLTIKAGTTLLLGMVATSSNPFLAIQPSVGNSAPTSTSSSIIGSSPLAVIQYSSDVANVAGSTVNDFSLSLTSMTTPLSIGPDGDFLSFNSSMAGVFGATPSVPEPGSVATLIGIGVTGTAFLFRRRRSA